MERILLERSMRWPGLPIEIGHFQSLSEFDKDVRDELSRFIETYQEMQNPYVELTNKYSWLPKEQEGSNNFEQKKWLTGNLAELSYNLPVFEVMESPPGENLPQAYNTLGCLKAGFSSYFSFVNTLFESTLSCFTSVGSQRKSKILMSAVDHIMKRRTLEMVRMLRATAHQTCLEVLALRLDELSATGCDDYQEAQEKLPKSVSKDQKPIRLLPDPLPQDYDPKTLQDFSWFISDMFFHYDRCFARENLLNRIQREVINMDLLGTESTPSYVQLVNHEVGILSRACQDLQKNGLAANIPTEEQLLQATKPPETVCFSRKLSSCSNDQSKITMFTQRLEEMEKRMEILARHNMSQRKALHYLLYYDNFFLSEKFVQEQLSKIDPWANSGWKASNPKRKDDQMYTLHKLSLQTDEDLLAALFKSTRPRAKSALTNNIYSTTLAPATLKLPTKPPARPTVMEKPIAYATLTSNLWAIMQTNKMTSSSGLALVSLEKQLEAVENEREQLLKERELLTEEIEVQKQLKTEYLVQIMDAQASIEDWKSKYHKLEQELDSRKQAKKAEETSLVQIREQEITALKGQLKRNEASWTKLNREHLAAQQALRDLRDQHKLTVLERDSLNSRLMDSLRLSDISKDSQQAPTSEQLDALEKKLQDLQTKYKILECDSQSGYEERWKQERVEIEKAHQVKLCDARKVQERVIDKLEREKNNLQEQLDKALKTAVSTVKQQMEAESLELKSPMRLTMHRILEVNNPEDKKFAELLRGLKGAYVDSLLGIPTSGRFLLSHHEKVSRETIHQVGEYSQPSLTDSEWADYRVMNDELPNTILDMTRISPNSPNSDMILAILSSKKGYEDKAELYLMSCQGKLSNLGHLASATYQTEKKKGRKVSMVQANGRMFASWSNWTYYIGPVGELRRVGYQEGVKKECEILAAKDQGQMLQEIRVVGDRLYWLSTNKFGRLSLSLMGPVQDPLSPVSFESEAKGGIATSFEVAEGLVAVAVSFDQLDPSGTPETRLGIYQEKTGQQPWVWEDVSDSDHVRWIRITKLNNGMTLLLLFFNSDKPTIKPVLFDGVKMLVGERVFFPEGGKPVGVVKLNQDAAVSSWILAHAKAYIHINVRL